MTGSALAIPLLGAAGASAASGTTWDKVADCESGGTWSADEGNGYYGGLQLTLADWEAHGGLAYAPTPSEASRSQQIAVAEVILASEGTGTWSGCGTLAGLAEDKESADVDTGVVDAALGQGGSTGSTGSAGSTGSTGSVGSDDAAKGTEDSGAGLDDDAAKSENSDKPEQKDDTDAESGSGRHRGESADEGGEDASDAKAGGRHASPEGDAAEGSGEDASAVEESGSVISIADSLALVSGWSGSTVANIGGAGEGPGAVLPGQGLDTASETGAK